MSEFNKIYDEYMKINSVTCSELAERISYKVFAESFWKEIAETELLTESVQKDKIALIESNLYNFAATIPINKLNKFFEVIEEGIFDKVGSFAKGFNKAVGLGAKALASGAVGAVKAGYNVAKGITKAGASIAGIFLPQSVKNLGAKVVARVKQGITDAVQHIQDAAKKVVDNLKKVKKDIANSAIGKEVIAAMKQSPTLQNLIKKLYGNADDKPRTDLFGAITKTLSDSKGSIILSIINILIGIYTGKYALDICIMLATTVIPIILDTAITYYKNKTVELERTTIKANPPVALTVDQQRLHDGYAASIKSYENTKAIAKTITTMISLSRLAMRGWEFFDKEGSDNFKVALGRAQGVTADEPVAIGGSGIHKVAHTTNELSISTSEDIKELIQNKKWDMPEGFRPLKDLGKPSEIYHSLTTQASEYADENIGNSKARIAFEKLLNKNAASFSNLTLDEMKEKLSKHAATLPRLAHSDEQASFTGYGIRTLNEKIKITSDFYNKNSADQIAKTILNATKEGVDLSDGKISDSKIKPALDLFIKKADVAAKIQSEK